MFNELNNLRVFFEEPDREVGVREYARLSKIAPATASSRLRNLVKGGFLSERSERNVTLFAARTESDFYLEAKRFYNISKIKDSGLIDFLVREFHEPTIFLFGSYAKAENSKKSDIDLFVISNTKKSVNLADFEKKLSPIQLMVHDPSEIHKLMKTNPHLLNNVLNGIRLYGFWEAL